jgi:2'-hydroxyisoflavone reductase
METPLETKGSALEPIASFGVSSTMRIDRRDFVRAVGALTLGACAPETLHEAASPPPLPGPIAKPPPRSGKRILVLGGTGFAGPPIVRAALAKGHTVTLFNRGKTAPGLFPEIETIVGDRVTQLDLLKGRDWDAVVDTWAPGPTLVKRAAELLRDRVGHYVFLSTVSVYELGKDPIDEGSPLLPLPPGFVVGSVITKRDLAAYGPLKVLAEQAAEAAMPGRSTSVRAGVLAGPGDPTDRFTYWPLRIARGAEMIAPGSPDDPMQYLDVRDLGDWFVTVIEHGHMGVFNAVGPSTPRFGAVLDACKAALAGDASLTWIPQEWLAKHDAGDWESFPLHVDKAADDSGFARVSAARAIAKGLVFRSPGDSAKDALAWWNAEPEARRQKRPGITPKREAELLGLWHKAAT